MKELQPLLTKRFSVHEGGEFAYQCNFLKVLKILHCWSDFFEYKPTEQRKTIKKWLKEKKIYIDITIYITFK